MSKDWAAHLGADRIAAIQALVAEKAAILQKQLGLPEETVGAVSALVASRLQP
jgi:hypothetical protein